MEEDFLIEVFNEQELEELNQSEPRKGHENRFAKKLHRASAKKSKLPFLKIAAAIALLLAVYGVGTLSQPTSTQIEIASFSQYFNSLIEEKTEGLDRYTSKEERLIILDALNELTELEEDAKLLHEDLEAGGDPQQIIKAMTNNYNSRLNLLEQLTKDLNDLKQ